jgi:Amt family ammonium transporter
MACVVTNLAAAMGGLTWMLLDYRLERKWSAVGFCSGAISGLVAITPGAGYVGVPASLAFGVVGAAAANFATRIKFLIRVDEALDVFASHAVGEWGGVEVGSDGVLICGDGVWQNRSLGGFVGCVLTAFFADSRVAGLDGVSLRRVVLGGVAESTDHRPSPPTQTEIAGGWINHHYIQLGYQLADATSAFGWSFTLTTILCWLFHYVPFLRLRASEESEILGLDAAEIGENTDDIPDLFERLQQQMATMGGGVGQNGHVVETKSASAQPESPTASSHVNEKQGGGRVDV